MLRTTLRSLWAHKRRLVSTCVAIILGVAFMAGTLVLNGTVAKIFDDLFAGFGQGVSAQVRGPVLFESQDGSGTLRGHLPEDTVDAVRAVDGVAAAEGSIAIYTATVVDPDGDAMGGFGPPVVVGSWDTDPQMASFQIAEGRAPTAAGEAVIDVAGAKDGGFALGDRFEVITGLERFSLTLVGTTRFGDADSAGGSTVVATTLAQAQEIAGEPGKINTVNARAEAGVTAEELVTRLQAASLGDGVDVVTGKQASDELASDVKQGFSFFTIMLTIFALIALFVGWFIISNTFNILVAQRTRELALLRAIGATRRQVMSSVFLEAILVGLLSGIIGLGVGIALAYGGFAVLRGAGLELPSAGLVIPPSAIAVSVIAGLAVTVIAVIAPAVRATRVPPIAALRDVAVDSSGRSRLRAVIGLVMLVAGLLLIRGAFKPDPLTDDLPPVGIGCALILISVLVLGPVIAGPLARFVGSPIPKLKGVIGTLARQNAVRSPRRTASTAAALIVGVALVTFIAVFASSTTKSITNAIGTGFEGDFIVMPANQFTFAGAPATVVDGIETVDGVERVTALGVAQTQATLPDGEQTAAFVNSIDPATVDGVFTFKMDTGTIADLAPGTMIIDTAVAKDHGLAVGDDVNLLSASGRATTLTVSAIGADPVMLGTWVLHPDDLAAIEPQAGVFMIGLTLAPDVTVEQIRPQLRAAIADYPQLTLQDRDEFRSGIVDQIMSLLMVIYVLLAVSVVISLIGIANTLSLSVHERTRELGLLRAMGMTRTQLRSSVRWEAIIVALIGSILGIALGVSLSFVLVKALASQGITAFSAPLAWLVTIAVVAAILAVAASLWPAYKASKLNVLEAIATE